ncbi:MAG: hypothetical protein IIA17_01470 [candidate division Zixibacteria bacterium]|nr:hypothetical protein [candidate division Zixibacteria bacterium]
MDPGTIVAGILTIAILSFLYGDNPVYKMAETLLVGVSMGYVLVITWTNTLMAVLFKPLFVESEFWLIIPFIFGLFMFGRFHKSTSFLSRYSMAVLIGSGAGVAIPAMLGARTLRQMTATVEMVQGDSFLTIFSGLVVVAGLFSTLSYFYFSREHEGIMGRSARVGTYFLMIFFGTTFGYTVMSRVSTFIGRMDFLLSDFLHLTN